MKRRGTGQRPVETRASQGWPPEKLKFPIRELQVRFAPGATLPFSRGGLGGVTDDSSTFPASLLSLNESDNFAFNKLQNGFDLLHAQTAQQ
ncbi:protein of unknown function [Nitrospina watsonii]|uniref:Uncharacterized protein n=1 Tax=Nitrospina watsonii TaxID=1323948 RepID=A0ABN8W417_9BACT|nr:protein of unknown function [Nitrospina watsonii]